MPPPKPIKKITKQPQQHTATTTTHILANPSATTNPHQPPQPNQHLATNKSLETQPKPTISIFASHPPSIFASLFYWLGGLTSTSRDRLEREREFEMR